MTRPVPSTDCCQGTKTSKPTKIAVEGDQFQLLQPVMESQWEVKPGEAESPLGPSVAKAQLGEVAENGYYGYRFRLLYSQGAAASGGAYYYLVNGRMLGGFAVIAGGLSLR